MVGKGQQGLVWNRIDRVRRREGLDVERVRCRRVFGAGAGPEQALRPRTGRGEFLPAIGREQIAVRLVGAHRDRDSQAVVQWRCNLQLYRHVPPADEERGDRVDLRVQAGFDAPLYAAQVGLRGRNIVLAREQQRDVDRNAVEDRLLDRWKAFGCAGDLDEEVRPGSARMQLRGHPDGVDRVVGEQRRDFKRDPAVGTKTRIESRPEQVGGLLQVFQRKFEEQALARQPAIHQLADCGVVCAAAADRMLEDGRIRGQPGHRQIGDVPRKRAACQQLTGEVVKPQTLTQIVQLSGIGVHDFFNAQRAPRAQASAGHIRASDSHV